MATLGSLLLNIGANISGLRTELRQAASVIDRFASDARAKLENFEKAGLAFAAVGAAITATFGAAGKVFGDFEAVMNGVQSVSSATASEMELLNATALKLGADTAFSAKEAADAFYELAKAGFTVEQQLASISGVLDLAAAGQLKVAAAAEISSAILKGFGLKAEEAARVADQLATAANSSAVDVTDVGESMKYVAPIARSASQELEPMIGMVAALGDVGIKGTQAGTALRASLLALQKPEKEAADLLHKLNISVQDSAGKMLPLRQIVDQLRESLAAKTEVEKNAAVAQIVGTEAASAFLTLMNTAPAEMDRYINAQVRATGAAKTMADGLNRGVNFAVQQFLGSVETLAIKIGHDLEPVILSFLEAATGLANAFLAFPEPLRVAIEVLAALAASVATISGIIGGISAVLPAVAAGFAALTGPVGLAVLGFTALAGAAVAVGLAMKKARDEANPSLRALEGQRNSIRALVDQYNALNDKTKRTKEEEAKRLAILEKIRDVSPELVGGIDAEGRAHALNLPALKAYNDELERKMRLQLGDLVQQKQITGKAMAEARVKLREAVAEATRQEEQAAREKAPVAAGGQGGTTAATEDALKRARGRVEELTDLYNQSMEVYNSAKTAVKAAETALEGRDKKAAPAAARLKGSAVAPGKGADDAEKQARRAIDKIKTDWENLRYSQVSPLAPEINFKAAETALRAFVGKGGEIGAAAEAAIADLVDKYADRKIKATTDASAKAGKGYADQRAALQALLDIDVLRDKRQAGRGAARQKVKDALLELDKQEATETRELAKRAADGRIKVEQETIGQRLAGRQKALEQLLAIEGDFGAAQEAQARDLAAKIQADRDSLVALEVEAVSAPLRELVAKFGRDNPAVQAAMANARTQVQGILRQSADDATAATEQLEKAIGEAQVRGIEDRAGRLRDALAQDLGSQVLVESQKVESVKKLLPQILALEERAAGVRVALLKKAADTISKDESLSAETRQAMVEALNQAVLNIETDTARRRLELSREVGTELKAIHEATLAQALEDFNAIGESLAQVTDVITEGVRSAMAAQKARTPAQFADALMPAADVLLALAGPWGQVAAGLLHLVVELWNQAETEMLERAQDITGRTAELATKARAAFDRAIAEMVASQDMRRQLVELTMPDPEERGKRLAALASEDLAFWGDLYGKLGDLEKKALAEQAREEERALALVKDPRERLEIQERTEAERTRITAFYSQKRIDAEKAELAAVKTMRDQFGREAEAEIKKTFLKRARSTTAPTVETDEALETKKKSLQARAELGDYGEYATQEGVNAAIAKITEQQAAILLRAREKPGVTPEEKLRIDERLRDLGRENARVLAENVQKATNMADAMGQVTAAIGGENKAVPRLVDLATKAEAAAKALQAIADAKAKGDAGEAAKKATGARQSLRAKAEGVLGGKLTSPEEMALDAALKANPKLAEDNAASQAFIDGLAKGRRDMAALATPSAAAAKAPATAGLIFNKPPGPGQLPALPVGPVMPVDVGYRPQGFNKGGLVGPLHFADGGGVPGQGEGDTVPALLTPGEIVIPKNLVAALSRAVQAMLSLGGQSGLRAAGGPANVSVSVSFGDVHVRDDKDTTRIAEEVMREVTRGLRGQLF